MILATLPRVASFVVALAVLFTSTIALHSVPHGWSIHRRADPDTTLPLKISLAQSNLHNLDAYLLDVSDPLSPNYGQHWTPARVTEAFRPAQETVDTVLSWLVEDHGIEADKIEFTRDGGTLRVNVTIAEAENILATECYVYRHNKADERVGCSTGYNLPDHVQTHIDFVSPTSFGGPELVRRDAFSHISGPRRPCGAQKVPIEETRIARGVKHCDQAVTLDCLRALYNFNYELVATRRNTVGIAEFGLNFLRFSDLDKFFRYFAPNVVGHHPEVIGIDGARLNTSDTDPDHLLEAALDFELLMGLLGRKQDVLLYQAGTVDNDPTSADQLLGASDASYCRLEGVAELGLKDCGDKPRANVVSISYTSLPDLRDPTILPMLQRECAEIGKLSLLGMTAIAASGDAGVAFEQEGICEVNGALVPGNQPGTFVGSFPASCPYVTAVGSTSVAPGKSVRDPEIATTEFPSGGGFSNAFPRPNFQESVVNNYLKHFAPPYGPTIFNRSGRAFPDVSANGWPLVVVVDGNLTLAGGTSASTPIFASIITAVNDARLAIGKRPVGWINPALYSRAFAHAFNDVTVGTNPGCGTEGFSAAPGWDPVTGLGTPNFRRLLSAFLSLP